MVYSVFPAKNLEDLLDKFEQNYCNLLLVSFRIVKPKFTKSIANEQKDHELGALDSVVIQAGPFLDLVKDFYFSDYNR